MKRQLLSAVLVCTTFAMTLPLAGCTPSQTENEINTVLTEATNVLVVAQPNAPWVPQLQAAIGALKAAEASWTSGGAVQEVINALNTVEAITAVIPLTAQYSPLIDVLVAGVEAILAALPQSDVASVRAARNPHIGRVTLEHHAFHSRSKEFVDTWNATAKAQGLVGAVIQ